jgi:hypothetical protein
VDDMPVVLERLHGVLENFIEFLSVPVELLLHTLAIAVSLPPNFQLGLEVHEALLDHSNVED